MKKILVYILSSIFLFCFVFVGKFNASEIECSYSIPLYGASGLNKNPKVKLKFVVDGNNVKVKMSGNELKVLSNTDYYFDGTNRDKVGDYYIALGIPFNKANLLFVDEDNLVCPDLVSSLNNSFQVTNSYKFEGHKKGDKVKLIKIYTKIEGFMEGATVNLDLLDKNGDIVTGDKNNTSDKKSCVLSRPAKEVMGDDKYNNVIEFVITAYKDGKYYVSVDGNGAYVNGAPDEKGVVWEQRSDESKEALFIIRESEIEEIKKNFSYDSKECYDKINITKLKIMNYETKTFYALSIGPLKDDGNIVNKGEDVTVDDKYDPNEDKDLSAILGFEIDSEIGVCVNYLGRVGEDSVANLLNNIYMVIKVASILLVIVMSMLDFAKAVVSSKDELMVSVKKLYKRLIILFIILLLPTLIDMLGNAFGFKDILCGIK